MHSARRTEGRVFQFTGKGSSGGGGAGGAFEAPPPWSRLALLGFVGLGLAVGAVDGGIAARAIGVWYARLAQPPGTPPDAVFGPVWGVLYVLMGVAAWRVWRRGGHRGEAGGALRLWGWQLAANAAWTPAFFGLRAPLAGLAVLVLLLGLIGATIRRFAAIDRIAAWLMVPYLLWSLYALYLNAGVAWLNRG